MKIRQKRVDGVVQRYSKSKVLILEVGAHGVSLVNSAEFSSIDKRSSSPINIPFDFVNMFRNLVSTPKPPSWDIKFPNTMFLTGFTLDLNQFDKVATILRYFELLGFVLGLIKITRSQMVKG